jgi:hypothetical protein
VVKAHENDERLGATKVTTHGDENSTVSDWAVKGVQEEYRHFRIFQTGPNSSNHHGIGCSGIELYGVLTMHLDLAAGINQAAAGGLRSSNSNPITCSGAPSARVLLVRAHLLVAYYN